MKPSSKSISFDPNKLNTHYLSTASRLNGSISCSSQEIHNMIKNLQEPQTNPFFIQHVTYKDVETELDSLRSDCSAGYDNIPIQYLKPVSSVLISPLTHIINSSIENNVFSEQWKIGKISPIPKIDLPINEDDFRPISVLPVLSKLYERLIAKQICSYIEQECIYKNTMSGFCKSHSTCTLLLKIRDDIVKALSKGEVTLAVYSDYSKAFDTVNYRNLIIKLNSLGFSKSSLHWMSSYMLNRQQFVQINDQKSSIRLVQFGVPQGSVLGPLLFNLYVTDLQDNVSGTICQVADDTTSYVHCKVPNIDATSVILDKNINDLYDWSKDNNLLFNTAKTKIMIFSTKRMSDTFDLNDINTFNVKILVECVERVKSWKVLGVHLDEHLQWSVHIDKTITSCYKILSILNKMKRFVRKNLVEALLFSRIDYCNSLFHHAQQQYLNRIQRLQNACCSFVLKRYCRKIDVINIGWLPISKRIEFSILKISHKALYLDTYPTYLKFQSNRRSSRNNTEHTITIPNNDKTFVGISSRLFNKLPSKIRSDHNFMSYSKLQSWT